MDENGDGIWEKRRYILAQAPGLEPLKWNENTDRKKLCGGTRNRQNFTNQLHAGEPEDK